MPYVAIKHQTKIRTELIASLIFYSEQHDDARTDKPVENTLDKCVNKRWHHSMSYLNGKSVCIYYCNTHAWSMSNGQNFDKTPKLPQKEYNKTAI